MKRFLAGVIMAATIGVIYKLYSSLSDAKTAFVVALSTIGVSIAELSKWLPDNVGSVSAIVGLVLACLTAYKVLLEIRILRGKLEE